MRSTRGSPSSHRSRGRCGGGQRLRQGIVPPIFVIAAYEVATNSLRRWGETTIARLWKEDEAQVCEVSDRRHIVSPLADRQKPAPLRGRPRAVAHPAT